MGLMKSYSGLQSREGALIPHFRHLSYEQYSVICSISKTTMFDNVLTDIRQAACARRNHGKNIKLQRCMRMQTLEYRAVQGSQAWQQHGHDYLLLTSAAQFVSYMPPFFLSQCRFLFDLRCSEWDASCRSFFRANQCVNSPDLQHNAGRSSRACPQHAS